MTYVERHALERWIMTEGKAVDANQDADGGTDE
jgi:hypothetical protein